MAPEPRPADRPVEHPLRWRAAWHAGGLVLIAVLIALSLLPAIAQMVARGEDKVLHAVAYAGLMLYYAGIVRPRAYLLVVIGLMGLGVAIEYAQGFLSHRVSDLYDVAANAVGLVIGLIIAGLGGRYWTSALEARIGGER